MEEEKVEQVTPVEVTEEDKQFIKEKLLLANNANIKKADLESKIALLKEMEAEYQAQVNHYQTAIDSVKTDLMAMLDKLGLVSTSLTDLFGDGQEDVMVEKFTRVTNNFDDEKVIALLKTLGTHPECLNIKTAIKKRELNKALKDDKFLNEKLTEAGLVGTTETPYVVVASSDTIRQMHSHIDKE